MTFSRDLSIQTPRLCLRATRPSDADRAVEIQSNWNVTQNLRMAGFPPDRRETGDWFAAHEAEWLAGTAFRFAILAREKMIGVIDIDEIEGREGALGFWLDEHYWGQGIAFEAGSAIVALAFSEAGLMSMRSGHAVDNPASGKVLLKLGFRHTHDCPAFYKSRGENVMHRYYARRSAGHIGA